jgi:hypothetical protein
MASETFYSPKAPVRYAHLIHADEYEGKFSYSCELLLRNDIQAHRVFLEKMEAEFVALHGAKKPRSSKGTPWRPDKTDPNLTVVRFKANRFDNPDGTFSKGPRIVDARKAPWDGREIGNGSELIVGFTCYPWSRSEGCGVTLQPKACQVVTFVPREDQGDQVADGFEEQEGGFSVAAADGYVDEFGDEEPF